jgi:hypothetical protein
MPRAPPERYELDQCAIAPDEKVCGDMLIRNRGEIGMRVAINAVGEEMLDVRTTEAAGRQADAVNHDQFRTGAFRSIVLIG